MSLSDTPCRSDAIGNNSTAIYTFNFQIVDPTDLLVITRDTSEVETVLAIDTDYSVQYEQYDSSGTITLLAGNLDTGYAIMMRRNKPLSQDTDIRNQGAYFPEVIEDTFDSGVMDIQQLQEQIDRSIKIAETELPGSFNPTIPFGVSDIANKGKAVIINDSADGFSLGEASGGGGGGTVQPFQNISADQTLDVNVANYYVDVSGGDVFLTLPSAPGNPGAVIEVMNDTFFGSNGVHVIGTINGTSGEILGLGENSVYKSNGIEWKKKN